MRVFKRMTTSQECGNVSVFVYKRLSFIRIVLTLDYLFLKDLGLDATHELAFDRGETTIVDYSNIKENHILSNDRVILGSTLIFFMLPSFLKMIPQQLNQTQ